jgi:integrase
VLAEAKRYARARYDSTMPRTHTLAQWLNRYYDIVRRYGGVSRRGGYVSHGLRHGYANDRFEALTGQRTAVRGGAGVGLSASEERHARQQVAEELGHSRRRVTTAYYGPEFSASRRRSLSSTSPPAAAGGNGAEPPASGE